MLHQCPSTGRGWGSWLYAQYYRGYSLNPLAPERECISINVDQPSLLWWGKTLIIKNIIYPRINNLKLAGLYNNIISLRLGRDGGSWPRGRFGMYLVPWIQTSILLPWHENVCTYSRKKNHRTCCINSLTQDSRGGLCTQYTTETSSNPLHWHGYRWITWTVTHFICWAALSSTRVC